jgi:serine protease AprX
MIKALEWVLDIRQRYNVEILNMSVAVNNINDKSMERYIKEMLELMWDYGIVVICAAGNNGPADGSISTIGRSRKLIAVGCHDGGYFRNRAESCENYSARGELFSTLRKPDIVAPGTDIVSCNAFIKRSGGRFLESYTTKSGTSMAAPIVSGAAALFLEKYHGFSPNDFRQKLTFTATDLGEQWNRQGWGMINVRGLLL